MVEQYLDPETVCKFGLTKRLLFKRRQRMRDKNLIIIFFDGVLGDLPYSSGNCLGFNSFRIRSGALKELKELSFQHQVVLVLPYVSKRSTVIGRYLHKFAACQVDAVYSVKSKEAKSTKKGYLKRWQDYEQVYRDFNMNDHQKILEEVLVIGCYTGELDGTMNQDGATDISDLVDDRFPELMGASGIRMRNEAEDYNRVNPITIMVPHLDLEIGSHCPISVLFQTIEVLKNTLLKYRQNPSIQQQASFSIKYQSNERDSRGPLDKARETLFSSQSKSRLLNINPEWLPKINFMETFTQLKEYELDLTTPPYEVGAATTGRIWKLQCFESGHLQRVILQHEKLADHLKVKTFQHRTELIKKYTKEDGTMDLPSYEETHPECPLHQFATLLNDNQATNLNFNNNFSSLRFHLNKVKAIDDYRQRYLSRTDKGYRQLVETLRFPPYDPAEDHCKGVNINDVKLDMRIDQYTMHRMIFLVPSPSVIQKVQTTGQYNQAFEYVDISKELADNVPYELASLIQANQQSTFEIQDWICRRMFTRPQNNGFIGPSGLAKRKGQQYVDADFHPTVPPGTGPAGNAISNSMGT